MTVSRGVIGGGIGTIILVVAALYFGIDPTVILQQMPNGGPPAVTTQRHQKPGADPLADFVSVVLADTEDTSKDLFRRNGKTYQEPKLVLFSGAAQSACYVSRFPEPDNGKEVKMVQKRRGGRMS